MSDRAATRSFPAIAAAGETDPQEFSITAAAQFANLEAAAEGEAPKRPTFSINAYTGVPLRVSAFYLPIVVDLKGLKAARKNLPILLNHDHERIVGQGTPTIDAEGVRIEGTVTGDDDDARKVVSHAKNGFEWQASIGANPTRVEKLEPGKTVTVNGREVTGPMLIAREALLGEVSFVAIGADHKTSATVAASDTKKDPATMNEFEKWLQAKGFDAAALTAEQKQTLKATFDAEQAKEKGKPTDLAQVVAAARKENERKGRIAELVAQAIQENDSNPQVVDTLEALGTRAETEGWNEQQTENAILRAARPSAGGGLRPVVEPRTPARVIEAAVCMAANLSTLEKSFDEQTLEAANDRFGSRGIGIAELVLMFARRHGFRELSVHNTSAALRAAFAEDAHNPTIQASGPSTYSLPGILGNIGNKFVRAAFESVDQAWRSIAAIASMRNFHEHTTYTLTGDLSYEEVPRGGELRHGTVGEETYTNKIETYGRLLGIDRRDLINDDAGAFNRMGIRIGRGGALKLNEVFWAAFHDNAAFFTSGRGNLEEGVFDADGLTLADMLFQDQTDPDGKPLGIMPKILLVPPGSRIAALRLMNSAQVFEDSALGGSNPWAGAFKVVSSPYMNNTALGGSTVKWYLLADPMDLPVIEVGFLNGVQTPTVATADMAPDRLGITFSAYFDFGARKQEYRAGVAMSGVAAEEEEEG